MATCSMCRKSVASMDDYLLADKPICSECAKSLNDLVESQDKRTVRDAFNYIYACSKQASDTDIANYLKEVLDNNSSAIEEFEEADRKKKSIEPVAFDKQSDYFSDKKEESQAESNIPAISLVFAVFAWINWIGGLIVAISVSTQMENGVIWFVGISLGFLFSGSLPMAVSYIIKYLSCIADNSKQIRKDLAGKAAMGKSKEDKSE